MIKQEFIVQKNFGQKKNGPKKEKIRNTIEKNRAKEVLMALRKIIITLYPMK